MYYFDYQYFVTIINFLDNKLFPCLLVLIFLVLLSVTINILRWYRNK